MSEDHLERTRREAAHGSYHPTHVAKPAEHKADPVKESAKVEAVKEPVKEPAVERDAKGQFVSKDGDK